MPLLTIIARVTDGLPLVASQPSSGSQDLTTMREQARQIIRKLNHHSPLKMAIDAGDYYFCYVIEDGMCYLTLNKQSFARRQCFAFLAAVKAEFVQHLQTTHGAGWRTAVDTVARSYKFIRFDKNIQQIGREYSDPDKRPDARLAEELADIHTIMQRNLQEVLNRGEKLETTSKITSRLRDQSSKYKWNATQMNRMAWLRRMAPWAIGAILLLAVLYWRFGMGSAAEAAESADGQ